MAAKSGWYNRPMAQIADVAGDQGASNLIESELTEYLHVEQSRRRLFPRAALVGLAAGAIAIAFRGALGVADGARRGLVVWAQQWPSFGWLIPVLVCAALAAASVWLVRVVAPEASGSGIPHLEGVLRRLRQMRWRRVLPVKFIGGLLALGSGMALGREGPTVQMGGATGFALAGALKMTTQERLIMMSAGAGAGLAAAFNAPLSGVIFVLEEMQRDFRAGVFGSAFIAAAVANLLARFASGQQPVFAVPTYAAPDPASMPLFIALGVACGLLGILFNRALIGALDGFARLSFRKVLLATAMVGGVAGLAAWIAPNAVGGGHDLAEQAVDGQIAVALIVPLFMFRFGLIMASYGSGAPGGIFAPLLGLGALLGLGIGRLSAGVAPGLVDQPAVFAVVGMAAFFTAIVRAPLTGIVLILEMTGNYELMLPLLVACFSAYAIAEAFRNLPIYEALLKRDLEKRGVEEPRGTIVIDIEVRPYSPFSGKLVRDLGLPPGCLIVRCRDGEHEWVPTADTRLMAHVRLSVVIPIHAEGALQIVQQGCEANHEQGAPAN